MRLVEEALLMSIVLSASSLLLICLALLVFHAAACGRRGESIGRLPQQPGTAEGVVAFPRAGHYAAMAGLFALLAVYGSLVPLNYRPLSLTETVARFREIRWLHLSIEHRADWVANIFLFVPISYAAAGALLVDRKWSVLRLAAVPLVLAGCVLLSVAIELTQVWFPPRTVSQNDIAAEWLGSLVGIGGWLLVGQALTEWMRCYALAARPKKQLDWLLEAYLVGFVLYSLFPMDLTLSADELVHKFRLGRIRLMPYHDLPGGFDLWYSLFRDFMTYVPVGMLAATWRTRLEGPLRPPAMSIFLGALAALGIEIGQVFVYSRVADSGDVITGTLGAAAGVWLAGLVYGRLYGDPAVCRSAVSWRKVILAAGVFSYAALLVVVFCAPFTPVAERGEWRARYEHFFSVPFAGLYWGTEFNFVGQVLKKTLFFLPLGVLLGAGFGWGQTRLVWERILLVALLAAAAGLAAAIEMLQVFFPAHVPDVTDVILYTLGAAAGLAISVRFVSGRPANRIGGDDLRTPLREAE